MNRNYTNLDTCNVMHFNHANGSVFDVTIPYTDSNGQPVDFTEYELTGWIKKQHGGPSFFEFSEEDDSITIEDNEIRLYVESLELPVGVYLWELRMEKDGASERIYKGTIQVNP